jgi:hypothetical protein
MLAAHETAYRETGTGSHEYVGLAGMGLCALLAVGLVLVVRGGAARTPAPLFALCPPLAFLLQEHAERGFDPAFVLEPAVLVGLALQVPFAVLAYAVARLLVRAADAIGRLLRPPHPVRRASRVARPAEAPEPRAAFVLAGAQRGPPAVSLS